MVNDRYIYIYMCEDGWVGPHSLSHSLSNPVVHPFLVSKATKLEAFLFGVIGESLYRHGMDLT
jgi:hypothetical protein